MINLRKLIVAKRNDNDVDRYCFSFIQSFSAQIRALHISHNGELNICFEHMVGEI
jgi:hypothetical protein